jgi:hypothetical protein
MARQRSVESTTSSTTPTAAEVLEFFRQLSLEDRLRFLFSPSFEELVPDYHLVHDNATHGMNVTVAILQWKLLHQARQPSDEIGDRNAAIMRLRDVDGLDFGKIPRRLQEINPAWVGKNGKLLSRDTVEKAHHRTKTQTPKDGSLRRSIEWRYKQIQQQTDTQRPSE